MMGAEKAIALVRFPQRLEMAKKFAKAEVINSEKLGKMPTPQSRLKTVKLIQLLSSPTDYL